MFHGNFWPHLAMDLETGRWVEKVNLLAMPSTLYSMTDPQFMVDHLKDDLVLQLYAYELGDTFKIWNRSGPASWIGHYNPRGNHFLAYSIKDTVVRWLDPKPTAYRKPNPGSIDFKAILWATIEGMDRIRASSRSDTIASGSTPNPTVLKQTPGSVRTTRSFERAEPFLQHFGHVGIQGLNFYGE